MSRMSEVYRLYLEEKRYVRSLTEDSWLERVAYSKGYQKPADKATKPETNVRRIETPDRGRE